MNKRFVKNNIGLLAVVSVCAVIAAGLLIFTLIEYVQMYDYISKIEGFPFSDRLSDMNSVVGDLLSGKVKSDLPIRHDTTPEEMLVHIQNLQKDKLKAYLRVR